jgi:hypothetical protein
MSTEQDVLPEGYVLHVRTSPVTDPWQPLFAKTAGGTVTWRFVSAPRIATAKASCMAPRVLKIGAGIGFADCLIMADSLL